jgi:hypothetical protein
MSQIWWLQGCPQVCLWEFKEVWGKQKTGSLIGRFKPHLDIKPCCLSKIAVYKELMSAPHWAYNPGGRESLTIPLSQVRTPVLWEQIAWCDRTRSWSQIWLLTHGLSSGSTIAIGSVHIWPTILSSNISFFLPSQLLVCLLPLLPLLLLASPLFTTLRFVRKHNIRSPNWRAHDQPFNSVYDLNSTLLHKLTTSKFQAAGKGTSLGSHFSAYHTQSLPEQPFLGHNFTLRDIYCHTCEITILITTSTSSKHSARCF